ncbi:rhomboid family intramembrane serine protease [Compostimonas suwonensis]|uniref:Membrane associated rhomboid family serine protease n=1 Tax=Compostimonas suwonensis TaxID=1048394 RepID=A0A2M9C431_9MICO|nr:rhomboid family intramembrane serine protease [Compostimonas suwonensis]PJJ65284.1 membrane associated rhomboid family serine protease [Compostimonas suwonensis]
MTEAPASRDNYCYRHPDRQSFVLCQRCGRTICPECQTQGAVGVICPECMKEQRQSAPRIKKRRVLTRLTGEGRPTVTYVLIAVTILVFVLQLIPGLGVTQALQYAGVYSTPVLFEPWRLLTAVFVHSTSFYLHVLLNMYTLWIFGRLLESYLGHIRFLSLYLISGLAGSVGVLLLADPRVPVVGASGAIFGLMGAFFVIQRRLGGNSAQLLVLLAINLVIGFIPGFNIAWQAHLGGLVGGALVGLIFTETRRRNQKGLQITLLVALAVVLIVASVIKGYTLV